MERITIHVDEETAREWEKSSPKFRSRVEKALGEQIEKLIKRNKLIKLDKLLDQLSDEAQANGLTEEILQEILSGDE